MIIRKALSSDSAGLTRLASLISIGNSIVIRIDRQPDFFHLLRIRGNYTVWIAEDTNGTIVGSFSETKQALVLNGKKRGISCLSDLMIHPEYQKTNIACMLVKAMRDELMKEEVDI